MRKAMLLMVALGLTGSLWATDPFVGTWKLNVARSTVTDPSAMPKSETSKWAAIDKGFKSILDGIDAEGKAYHMEVALILDGTNYPINGNPNMDMRSAKKIDSNTILFVTKKAGKEVRKWRFTFSKDSKTMTMIGKGITPKGQAYSGSFVYDKQ